MGWELGVGIVLWYSVCMGVLAYIGGDGAGRRRGGNGGGGGGDGGGQSILTASRRSIGSPKTSLSMPPDSASNRSNAQRTCGGG